MLWFIVDTLTVNPTIMRDKSNKVIYWERENEAKEWGDKKLKKFACVATFVRPQYPPRLGDCTYE